MDKIKLEMDFLDQEAKRFRLGIENPKEGLDDISIGSAMQKIIDANIFQSKGGNLVEIEGARLITTSISEVEF